MIVGKDIKRADSWKDIFTTQGEADRQYDDFLRGFRKEYTQRDTKIEERRETDPQTGIDTTVFDRGNNLLTKVERLVSGNVVITFDAGNNAYTDEVVPEVGNLDHALTYDAIICLREELDRLRDGEKDPYRRNDIVNTSLYLKGEPATQVWEELFLFKGFVPERVGYKIYPKDMVDKGKQMLEE